MYMTYGRAQHLNLQDRAVRRVHATFILETSEKHTSWKPRMKPWDRTTGIEKIPVGEAGVNKPKELNLKNNYKPRRGRG